MSNSPVSILDSTKQTAVSIFLKSGSTIHADTVKQDEKNVSYTIGEDEYEIPVTLVEKIVKQDAPPPKKVPLTGATTNLGAQPGFESTAELRRECANGTAHVAPMSFYPVDSSSLCPAMEIDMGSSYEANVDDAMRAAQTLCAKYEGPLQYLPRPKDPDMAGIWQAFQDSHSRIQEAQYNAAQKVSSLSPLSSQQVEDLNKESTKLTNRLDRDNPIYNASPDGHLSAQERAAVEDRLNTIGKMLSDRPQTPEYRAALLRAQRTQIDFSRTYVVCQGSFGPKK
jgi:hypothetical protein